MAKTDIGLRSMKELIKTEEKLSSMAVRVL